MNYGYLGNFKEQAKKICDCLGYSSSGKAHLLMLETACAETGLGQIKDKTVGAGLGLTQFDKLPFKDTKNRGMRYRAKIKAELGIDIQLVKWEHLRYSPFLALLFTRIFYLLRKGKVPDTLEGRARYWKKYYNTRLGKGTPEHYIKMVEKFKG